MTITAAAHGSALGNPGPAGWTWYLDDDDDCWAAGGWPHATNNQGELMAVLDLFRATEHIDDDLHILCDSQYVINCITQWMPGVEAQGLAQGRRQTGAQPRPAEATRRRDRGPALPVRVGEGSRRSRAQ